MSDSFNNIKYNITLKRFLNLRAKVYDLCGKKEWRMLSNSEWVKLAHEKLSKDDPELVAFEIALKEEKKTRFEMENK